MLDTFHKLVVRDDRSDDESLSPTIINLLISLLVLVLLAISLVGVLVVLRRKRRALKQSELPVHNGQCTTTNSPNHRRLTITAHQTDSMYVYDEKRNLMENSTSPPGSPVPAIHITFPEEENDVGKRQSGRVVVVRIGEKGGVGLEPYQEDLPPYQSNDSQRFQSLDIERMGGLKEKEEESRWS